jgi:hypothetical protein
MITSDNGETIKSSVFWDIMLCTLVEVLPMFQRSIPSPSSELKNNPSKHTLLMVGWLANCLLVYSSALKIEAIHHSEIFINFYQTQTIVLFSHSHENIRSHRDTTVGRISVTCKQCVLHVLFWHTVLP